MAKWYHSRRIMISFANIVTTQHREVSNELQAQWPPTTAAVVKHAGSGNGTGTSQSTVHHHAWAMQQQETALAVTNIN
jgi:hypothetical protein